MKKFTGKGGSVNSEGIPNPELLFCDDALVVDYLNALLASEPALKMDFREIHFVHQEMQSHSKDDLIIGNAMLIGTEASKTEADVLKSENENLKFISELASIDAQVLRDENNKLKVEKESLVAQLSEMKETLSSVLVQSDHNKQITESYLHQLDELRMHIEDQAKTAHADLIPDAEKAAAGKIDPDSEQAAPCEVTEQVLPSESVAVARERGSDDKSSIPIDRERLIISEGAARHDTEKTRSSHDSHIFSQEKGAGTVSLLSAPPRSKFIKHNHVEKQYTPQISTILKASSSPEAVSRDGNINEASSRLNFVPQSHVAEVEAKEEEAPVSQPAPQPRKDTDEINVPTAPAPKVVIRRVVKNYEALQKESDSINTPEVGHTIIL